MTPNIRNKYEAMIHLKPSKWELQASTIDHHSFILRVFIRMTTNLLLVVTTFTILLSDFIAWCLCIEPFSLFSHWPLEWLMEQRRTQGNHNNTSTVDAIFDDGSEEAWQTWTRKHSSHLSVSMITVYLNSRLTHSSLHSSFHSLSFDTIETQRRNRWCRRREISRNSCV